jgi:TRAP-type uncharacterized transport system fused permease subunit
MRSLHVGFLLLLTFLLYPAFRQGAPWPHRRPWDWLLAAGAFVLCPATSGSSRPT